MTPSGACSKGRRAGAAQRLAGALQQHMRGYTVAGMHRLGFLHSPATDATHHMVTNLHRAAGVAGE